MRRRFDFAGVLLGLGFAVASCAVVGYDLDGYRPANESTAAGGGGHGASSRASSGGGVAAGGSGAGGGGSEDCTNGVDDNGDGLVDCADPACSAFACAPDPPAGWSGPFAFYAGPDPSVACSGHFAVAGPEGGTGVVANPVTCGACGCDAAPCSAIAYNVYGSSTCGMLLASGSTGPFACAAPGSTVTWGSLGLAPVGITAGCPAHGGGLISAPPPAYADHALLCGPVAKGRGCGAGAACVPKPAAPLEGALCVSAPGDKLACPADYPTPKGNVYTGITDTRDCTGCTCGGPSSNLCNAGAVFYGDTACQTATAGAIADGACYAIGAFNSYAFYANGPTCTPGGGQATGTASGKDPQTVCCR
jgi:hypothetical protein